MSNELADLQPLLSPRNTACVIVNYSRGCCYLLLLTGRSGSSANNET